MNSSYVIFIEAPGKLSALTDTFQKIGFSADIIATKGHLYSNPAGLTPLGINQRFEETMRKTISDYMINKICDARNKYKYFLIATDPDQEGDVIAADIYHLLQQDISGDTGKKIFRLDIHGMDPDSVKAAIKSSKPFDFTTAWPGTTRRILDRLIGASLSDHNNGISVGRIQSAMLGEIHRQPLPYATATFHMKDEHGGPDFVATIDVDVTNQESVQFMLKEYRANPLSSSVSTSILWREAPWNHAECVIACADKLDASIEAVSESMQRLYESGALSYPRSSARAHHKNALDCLTRIAQSNGVSGTDFSGLPIAGHQDVHESPRPLVMVDISMPLKLLHFDDAVLAVITRNLIKSGIKTQKNSPDTSHLPMWAKNLPWQQLTHAPYPWHEHKMDDSVVRVPKDIALLKMLARLNLGRPSTQIEHVVKFTSRDLLRDDMVLNEKGMQWLKATPPVLLKAENSIRIESMISERSQMPPDMRVQWILEQMGEAVSGSVSNTIAVKNAAALESIY